MNVFGNDPAVGRVNITSTHIVDNGLVQDVVIAFPPASFIGASTSPQAIALELNLTGTIGTAANRGLINLTSADFVDPVPGVTLTLMGVTYTTATLALTTATGTFPNTDGFAIRLSGVRVNNANVQLGVRRGGVTGAQGQLMPPTYLAPAGGDITIHGGTVRDFAEDSTLFLDTIQIREVRLGNFTARPAVPRATHTPPISWSTGAEEVLVRLEAPAYYRWVNEEPDVSFRLTGVALPILSHSVVTERIAGNDFEVKYLRLDTSNLTTAPVRVLETIEIDGLALRPTRDAQMGDVAIRVALVSDTITGTHSRYQQANLFAVRNPDANNAAQGRFFPLATITVGRRVDSTMSFIRQNAIPTVRTGTLVHSPGNELRGVQTAAVELRENSPDAWGIISGDRRAEFTFDQPGVTVIGATVRFGYNTDRNNYFGDFHVRDIMTGNANEEVLWVTQQRTGANSADTGRAEVSITPNGVEVFLSGHRNSQENLVLRVTFFLSIEPGFEASNPGEDIYVTVGGRGLGSLPYNERRLAVATPADPVAVSVSEVTQIPTNPLGAVFNHPVGDIEIDVFQPHNLNVGDTFSVRIAGSGASAHLGLAFDVASIQSSLPGLAFGQPVYSTPQGIQAGTILTFTVTRRPLTNQGEATITLSGIRVTGQVHPETEYNVILSGTAVAGNLGTAATRAGTGSNLYNPRDIGRFDYTRQFYRTHILTYGGGIVTDPGPGQPGTTLPGTQLPARPGSISLWQGMPTVTDSEGHEKANPFMFHSGVSMMGIRAFAHLAGLDAPVWDGANNQATLSGVCVTTGDNIQLLVGLGSFYAQITRNGVQQPLVDIASASNYLSGPRGTVRPLEIEGRIFLPVRFVAEAFGFVVDWDGSREIVTLR